MRILREPVTGPFGTDLMSVESLLKNLKETSLISGTVMGMYPKTRIPKETSKFVKKSPSELASI